MPWLKQCLWKFGRAFDETKRELLAVESHKALLSDPHTSMLQAKLKLRTPYITPLNILQVRLAGPSASGRTASRYCLLMRLVRILLRRPPLYQAAQMQLSTPALDAAAHSALCCCDPAQPSCAVSSTPSTTSGRRFSR